MSKKKPKRVIPAVSYCRKSTNEERTEKSIADQIGRIKKLLPPDDNSVYEIVRWYEKDKGVPGWKRGAERPDFQKLVDELKETGAKAILVDDMDRFSRADLGETVHDVQALREIGIRYIHAVNQGCRDLEGGMVVWMQIAMEAMASHEHCTRLSRRIANARLDAARQGKRSGGRAPYGFVNDGKGGLKHGDPKQVKVVRQIYDWFVNDCKSMNWIAEELNRQKITATGGGLWSVPTIRELLRRQVYLGCFTYNKKKTGQFHIVNEKQEVVPVSQYQDKDRKPWVATDEGVFLREGAYKPLIDRKTFAAAQKRLASFSLKGGRRPRADGYPLSGILFCGHCNKPMYGCKPNDRKKRVYRCSTPAAYGDCKQYWINESDILPFVLRKLGEEIKDIKKMLTAPPEKLRHPNRERAEHRAQAVKDRDDLAAKIKIATRNVMLSNDARTRKEIDAEITAMRDSLEKLELELSGEEQPANGYSRDDLKALAEWWDDFDKRAVSVPVKGKLPTVAHLYQDPMSDEAALLMDARDVNIMLHHLGAKVVLCWDTTRVTLANGKTQNRYKLAQARFFLGRKNVIKLKVPPSEETMHIILAAPRGFCAGVNMAVESLNLAIQAFGTPIYVYHEIVHNRWVVEHFRRQGVVFVDDLSQVPHSAHLLYSAHGVPPEIRRQAALQNLITIDATCPLVTKVHAEAIRFASQGYTIILIGHAGHDEVVGTLGEAPQSIVLVQSPDDVGRLDLPDTVKVAYLTQTTLSVDDAANIIGRLRQRFPHIVGPVREDVCYATQHRQEAVRTLAREADMVIVVGSCNSSNSQRLAEMARSQGTPAHLIDGPDDIDFTWFTGGETIAVTAGASAPDAVVRRCVALLKERFNATIESRVAKEEQIRFTLPEPLRGI